MEQARPMAADLPPVFLSVTKSTTDENLGGAVYEIVSQIVSELPPHTRTNFLSTLERCPYRRMKNRLRF